MIRSAARAAAVPMRPGGRAWIAGVATCTLLAGCGGASSTDSALRVETPRGASTERAGGATGDTMSAPRRSAWRSLVTTADRTRLREWRTAWVSALAQLKPGEIAAQGDLFAPDRVLEDPIPPAGGYRCRTFKLGAPSGSGLRFVAYGWFPCRISAGAGDGVSGFVKDAGSQRPVGSIYAESKSRGIFLGSMQLADERHPMRYGTDHNRDMAGLVERIGARRWRLVLPYPRFESTLDVVEIVPAD
ncbi:MULTISPECIES: DUF4893 domain-containing protein [unclassified Sphingomonas]|uniref:DUF4893 domain-containing protein n=1 Tax=Sphingomonas sp. PvP015 TaxID=3156388 RepID=UPI0033972816